MWRSPRAEAQELVKAYQATAFSDHCESQRAIYTYKGPLIASRLLDKLERDCQVSTGELLDLGCGYGFLLQEAAARGFSVYGLELSSRLAAEAQQKTGRPVVCGVIEQAPYPNGSFDVVTMLDVLEHVACPTFVLQRVISLLRPGGILAIRVPDMNGLLIHIVGALYQGTFGRYHYPMWLLWRYHTFGFSVTTLGRYMKKVGLRMLCYYGDQSKDLSTLHQKPWAANSFIRFGVRIVVKASQWLNMPDELVMFAQKPG